MVLAWHSTYTEELSCVVSKYTADEEQGWHSLRAREYSLLLQIHYFKRVFKYPILISW